MEEGNLFELLVNIEMLEQEIKEKLEEGDK